MIIKYSTHSAAIPPRPIRLDVGGWSGTTEKMVDGSNPQPWHCMPFYEGSTYGFELIYPYDTPCDIVNDAGAVRIEWDYSREPGGILTGFEFVLFAPVAASKYYLFSTRIDMQPPPGYVLRTEPHPQFFTDETDTFPLAMIGHLQNEWYPRLTFIVFRAPRPGQRHIFRKGQPYAQVLFVPKDSNYKLVEMTPEEDAKRRELEQAIQESRSEIANHAWKHPDNTQFNNHYKVLAREFASGGITGVEEVVRAATERHKQTIPTERTLPEYLSMGRQFLMAGDYQEAHRAYAEAYRLDPRNANALMHLGICFSMFNSMSKALELVSAAVALEPNVPYYQWNLAELLRRLGRLPEAESSIRAAVSLDPSDSASLGLFALILAEQGRTDEAMQGYRMASMNGRPSPQASCQMGMALAKHGALADARTCFEAALALDPEYATARQALADAIAKMRGPV